MQEGSKWFRRFIKEIKAMSPDVRIVRMPLGFYRIYYRQAYLYEAFKEMPEHGYDYEDEDPRLTSKLYYEEFEDKTEFIRTIKNFKEGYWDSIDSIRTRVYLMKNNQEFYERSTKAYQQMVVK